MLSNNLKKERKTAQLHVNRNIDSCDEKYQTTIEPLLQLVVTVLDHNPEYLEIVSKISVHLTYYSLLNEAQLMRTPAVRREWNKNEKITRFIHKHWLHIQSSKRDCSMWTLYLLERRNEFHTLRWDSCHCRANQCAACPFRKQILDCKQYNTFSTACTIVRTSFDRRWNIFTFHAFNSLIGYNLRCWHWH